MPSSTHRKPFSLGHMKAAGSIVHTHKHTHTRAGEKIPNWRRGPIKKTPRMVQNGTKRIKKATVLTPGAMQAVKLSYLCMYVLKKKLLT